MPRDRPLIAGTGRESTKATIAATRRAADLGADAVLVRTPSFFKTADDERDLRAPLRRGGRRVAHPRAPLQRDDVHRRDARCRCGRAALRASEHRRHEGVGQRPRSTSPSASTARPTTSPCWPARRRRSSSRSARDATARCSRWRRCVPDECVQMVKLVKENRIAEARALQRKVTPLARSIGGGFGDHRASRRRWICLASTAACRVRRCGRRRSRSSRRSAASWMHSECCLFVCKSLTGSKRTVAVCHPRSSSLRCACATNPGYGQTPGHADERGAGDLASGRKPTRRSRRRWASTTIPTLQDYVSDIGMKLAKISERPNLPWHFTVVDVAGRQRVRAAGRLHLHHARHPAVSRQRGAAGRRARPRDRPRHRAARGAAVHARGRRAGRPGRARHLRARRARPFGQLAEQALGVLFLKYGRDDELQADRARRAVRVARGLGSRRRARDAVDARTARRGVGQTKGMPNWLSTHPEPLDARQGHPADGRSSSKAGRTDFARNRDALAAAHRRPHLRRQPGAGHRARQRVPASAAALPDRFSRAGWEIAEQPAAGRREGAGRRRLHAARAGGEAAAADGIEDIALQRDAATRASGSQSGSRQHDQRARRVRRHLPGAAAGPRRRDDARRAHRARRERLPGRRPRARRRCSSSPTTAFLASIRSFRPLSAAEAEDIHPNRIDLYVVARGRHVAVDRRAVGRRRSSRRRSRS